MKFFVKTKNMESIFIWCYTDMAKFVCIAPNEILHVFLGIKLSRQSIPLITERSLVRIHLCLLNRLIVRKLSLMEPETECSIPPLLIKNCSRDRLVAGRSKNTFSSHISVFKPASLSWLKRLSYKQEIVGSSPTVGICTG